MKALILIVILLTSGAAFARAPSSATTHEIDQLFVALKSSQCELSRNGSWYTAEQASKHLHRKYDYLLKKGLITSAESFIDLAATKSSMSGKPYMVRCGSSAAVSSASWFTDKLEELRNSTIF